MSYTFYKFIHLAGVMLVFLAYGGVIAQAMTRNFDARVRKFGAIMSGVGLLLLLVGGFGMQAKLHLGFPGWVIAKIVIWFVLGGMVALINRKPELGRVWWWLTLILGLTAAIFGIQKPF